MTNRHSIHAAIFYSLIFAVSLLMATDYARLILFTETAAYRFFVLLAWVGISVFSMVKIIQLFRNKRNLQIEEQ